jgi:eukaryotic-like serine/threonine-protein kinase
MSLRYSAESEALFAAVFELSPEARAAAIDSACVDRPDLRRDIESLLAAHDVATDFLRPPWRVTDHADNSGTGADADAEDLTGTRIGAFTVTGRLGRGGMSDVYRAERSDGTFEQAVAIKIARVALTDPDAIRRFKAERQILAILQHPHIVALIDGGALPDGRPYLVTELVTGTTISSHCRTARLDLDARLRLFRQVCQAVHYAHGHGVVHRDLKPANLLVTPDGVPKILDFGVAKLLSPVPGVDGLTPTTINLTGPLTPNYASPEQLRGLPVTTASDVYTLGILLYEILTGTRPYETAGRPLDDVMRLVIDTEPVRPSVPRAPAANAAGHPDRAGAGAEHDTLPYDRRRLRGDLDAIVLKAMAKERERRYASAAEFADDIARYLGDKPVLACEPSAAYTLRKLAARHKAVVATAIVAALGVLASLSVALWQHAQADRQRATAERRFADVRQLAHALIFDIHDAVVPLPGSTPVRKQIVERALEYLENLRADSNGDPGLQLELSQSYRRIGEVLGAPSKPNLGDRQGAIARLRQARDLARTLATQRDATPASLTELVRADNALSLLLGVTGERTESQALAREAQDAAERLVARDPQDPEHRQLLASARFQVALGLLSTPDAPAAWPGVITAFEELLVQRPDDPSRLRNVALAEKYLGSWYDNNGRAPEALPHYRRAIELDTRRVSLHPDDRQALMDLAIDQANVAGILRRTDLPGGIAMYEQSVATRRHLAETDPRDIFAVGRLGAVLWRLSLAYREAGRMQEAVVSGEEATRVLERAVTERHDVPLIEDLAVAKFYLGEIYDTLHRPTAACAAWRRVGQLLPQLGAEVHLGDVRHLRAKLPARLTACAQASR